MYDDVSSASKTFSNGSKLGNGTIYSSKTTFEIADEYKGDIARGYFYMAIRYSDKISSWSAGEVKNVFSSSYPYLTQNAIKVFTKWAHEDPVSDKEMLRNEATYALQNNRNPFIDHPEWVDTIWTNNYTNSKTKTVYSLSDVKSSISNLSSSSSEDTVYSAYNKYCRLTVADKALVSNDTTLFNYVKAKSGTSTNLKTYWDNVISTYNSTYGASSVTPTPEENNYSIVTSTSNLKAGDKVILSYKDGNVALSKTQNTSNRGYTSVSISNNQISSPLSSVEVVTLENGSTSGSFRFKTSSGSYLTIPSDANKLTSTTSLSNKCDWVISISSGKTKIKNVCYSQRYLEYKTTNKVFAGYKATQKDVSLFRLGGTEATVDLSTYTNQFKNNDTKAILNLSYNKEVTQNKSNTTSKTVSKSSFTSISGSLDSNISYLAAKGSASTNPGVYSNIIRVYQNGGVFTVSSKNNATITSVTIGSSMATKVTYSIDNGSASQNQSITAGGKLTVNNIQAKNKVLFTCKGTSSSQRLYVNYISVTYSIGEVQEVTTYTYSNALMDFKGTISKDLYKSLGNSASYGVRIKKGSGSYSYYNITPTLSNNSYVISKNISVGSDYSTVYTAEVYVLINGTYYYMNASSYSFKALVTYYINNASALGVSSDMLEALKAFK
jgi:hypothetical protein